MKKAIALTALAVTLVLISLPLWAVSVYDKFFTLGTVYPDDPTHTVFFVPNAVFLPEFRMFKANVLSVDEFYGNLNPSARHLYNDEHDFTPFYEYFTSFGWCTQTMLLLLNIYAICHIARKRKLRGERGNR